MKAVRALLFGTSVLACSGERSNSALGPQAQPTANLAPATVLVDDDQGVLAPLPTQTKPVQQLAGDGPLPTTVLNDARAAALYELAAPIEQCSLTKALAELGGCRLAPVKRVRASSAEAEAKRANDGDACTWWNAGTFPPAALALEFVGARRITALLLVPEQTPPQLAGTHVVEIDQGGAKQSFRAHGTLTTNRPYLLLLPEPINATAARVVTSESTSWVAFRELQAIECDAALRLPPSARLATGRPEPVPQGLPFSYRVVRGQGGACKTHDDCVRADCCSSGCASRAKAKPCAPGTGCGQAVTAFDRGAQCACIDRACVTLIPESR